MIDKTINIIVPPGQKKERLDVFLAHQIENASRNRIQNAIKAGHVTINGAGVKSNHSISPGEKIEITLPRAPFPDAEPEEIPLDIVYEDDSVIIINKPADMVTHPAHGNYTGTLVNALLHHTRLKLGETGDPLRPGIVHRLDKDTSGLIVAAKTEKAIRLLGKQFAGRTIEREYQAVVWGTFKKKEGTIEAKLGRNPSDRKKIAVREDGKPALTGYRVLEEYDGLSLLELRLMTGRTHQIRVHLAFENHPVFGDPSYGGRRIVYGGVTPKRKAFINNLLSRMPRQALHAKTLGFIHPETGARLHFESPLPEDMSYVIEQLRSFAVAASGKAENR